MLEISATAHQHADGASTSPLLRGVVTVRRRLSRGLLWAAGVVLLAPFAATAIGRPLGWAWLKPWALGALPHALWLGPLLAIIASFVARPRTTPAASMHIGDTDVELDAAGRVRRFARADIEGGMLVPSVQNPHVEVYLRGGDVLRLAVADEAAATSLLGALDIGPDERRVRVTLADPARRAALSALRAAGIILVFFFGLGMAVGAYERAFGTALPHTVLGPWLALVVGTIAGLGRLGRPTEVVVGSEGVRIVSARGKRTIPYDEIEDVVVAGGRLEIRQRSGGSTCLAGGWQLAATARTLPALARRIRDGMIAAKNPASDGLAAQLERGERSLPEWRSAVSHLLGRGGFRDASLARDVAEHVLDDGTATVERRVGAALALAANGGDEGRTRIRIAADKTTDDKLRIALQRVADGDDGAEEEIEQALAQQPTPRRAAR